jgi:uncharacterized membrane protein
MLLFIAYILIGILFWKLSALREELEQVKLFRRHAVEPAVPVPLPHVEQPVAPTPVVRPEPAFVPPFVPVVEVPIVKPVPTPQFTASERLEKMAASTGGWEQLIGGNLLNKLGAFVLVIGIALFLSYSFANMGPAGRAFTGLGLSVAILVGGVFVERLEKYKVFSRGILAAGWAGLYFTTYAMHALPAARIIENPVLGTLLMVATAIGMVAHSLRYRLQSLTALAYGCIFGALALSTVNTFVAISLIPLAVSMLYLARKFEWHALGLFAAVATYAVFLTRPDSGASLAAIQSMLFLFWLLFESFDLLRIRASKVSDTLQHALFAVNAVAGLGASAVLWFRTAPDSMWIFCTGAAVLYLASTWLRFVMDGETLYEYSLTISALLTGLAIFARVPGLWASIGLMVEAEVLFLAALRLRIPVAKALSWLGFVAVLRQISFKYISADSISTIGALHFHDVTPPLVILSALFYLNRRLAKDESYWSYVASGLVTLVLALESTAVPFVGVAWLIWSALLFEFGLRTNLTEFRVQSYGVAALSVFAILFSGSDPIWRFELMAAAFYLQSLRATRWLPQLSASEQTLLGMGGAAITTLFTSAVIVELAPDEYQAVIGMAVSLIFIELGLAGFPRQLLRPAILMNIVSLMGVVLRMDEVAKHPETSVAITFGGSAIVYYWLTARFLRSQDPARKLARVSSAGFASLFALLTAWMLLPPAMVPMAFVALALLTAEAGFSQGAGDVVWVGRGVATFAAVALLFDVPSELSLRLADSAAVVAAHFFLRFRRREEFASPVHNGIAILTATATLLNEVSGGMLTLSWSLEGIVLLAAGFAFRDRWLRLPGLTLLLLCIGKVFFYDLRNLETIYRILSFIGLGLILLGVSWIYTRFKEQLQKLL